jgi:apolipoprotein D and lipocalin family protein
MRLSPFLKGRALLGLAVLLFAVSAQADPLVQVAKPIDPNRYLGRWYELARLPNKFQDNCAAATSDWSRQPNGQFDVVQTCRMGSPNGPAKIWRGAGRVVDPVKAMIRIGFFGGFIHMDYRIMDRADDYSWCILTNGNPKFMWIMSKQPNVPAAQRVALIDRAKRLGFDVSGLVYDNQPAD